MGFRDQPIRRKLAIVTMGATMLALLLATAAFFTYERSNFRGNVVSELTAMADTLGANAAASLAFRDKKTGEEILGALQAEQHVMVACLYDERGEIFAAYRRKGVPASYPLPALRDKGAYFTSQSLSLVRGLFLNDEPIGSIVIESDLGALHAKLREYARIAVVVLLLSMSIAGLASSRLLRIVSSPIVHLAEVAERVSTEHDYSLRAISDVQDESGKLIHAFNQMLEGIQQRDSALQKARDEMEARVLERTSELQKEVVERKQAETKMRAARDAAEVASRAKSEFLANMSHEIRTPLNGVIGMTELALDTELSAELREYLNTIQLSANTLLTVINDILDFSKIEAGKIEMEATDFNLHDSVEETLKSMALHADEKGLELVCDIAPNVPEWVTGDPIRLRQVLLNLIGNAIKFTKKGEVAVQVRCTAVSGTQRTIQITVADTGIGIAAEKQKFIFDPFTQADTSTTRNYGGTGLGLTISARLISMMGGNIWLDSELGQGSRFHFTVVLPVAQKAPEGESTGLDLALLQSTRVLVVDDNETNRRILSEMLKRWQMEAVAVGSGEQALQELERAHADNRPYRLVLTDMHMPEMDGFELVEQIRKRSVSSTPTILMLTSGARRGDTERCRTLGIDIHLYKPVRRMELLTAILASLGRRSAVSCAALAPAATPRHSTSLKILLAEDNPVNQTVATRILQKMGHAVTVANNGVEALSWLERSSFDLVLMDIQMPLMDGFASTRNIRKREANTHRHQVIIAMTAHAMKGDRERCLEAGMDGYVTKPITRAELEAAISETLHWPSLSQRPAGDSASCPVPSLALDRAQVLDRLGGDECLLQEILGIFIEQAPKHLSTLKSALLQKDAAVVETTAHSMKGELGYLGLSEVSQKARELEELGRKGELEKAAAIFDTFQSQIRGIVLALIQMKDGNSLAASQGAGT